MKNATCMLIAFLLCLSLIPVSYADNKSISFSDDPKAMQIASNSVVMLNCYDKGGNLYSTGSAFAAFDNGIFITNFHVIDGDVYSIRAQIETGSEFTITSVVAYDTEKDIAILGTEADTGLNPLPLGDSSKLERGEKVIAIGSPLGLINTLSIGLYSGIIKEKEQMYLQFSAAISHGSSGGALFNNNGEVVGITSASYEDGQNLNLAIPIEDAVALWDTHIGTEGLSFPEFYDLWVHADFFDITYIRSHKSEFTGQTILTGGNVFYIDKNADRFWIIDPSYDITSLSNESFLDIRNAASFPMICIFEKPSKVVFGEYITVQATAVLDHLSHVIIIQK